MKNYFSLVRSKTVRDFDDIYEGGSVEAIGSRLEIIPILTRILKLDEWAQSPTDTKTWIGRSNKSTTEANILVVDNDIVAMLGISNADLDVIESLKNELGLRVFE